MILSIDISFTNCRNPVRLSLAEFEEKQRQLNLDLELAHQNLKKAKDEVAGTEGNDMSTVYFDSSYLFVLLFDPSVYLVEKMRLALAKKDLDLAAAEKEAQEKTALADKKLASVGALEEDNAKLKASLTEANKEVTHLKKDKVALNEKIEGISRKRNDLEAYLGALAKKLFLMLEGIFLCSTYLLFASHHELVDSLTP